jgi:hypothetical protein
MRQKLASERPRRISRSTRRATHMYSLHSLASTIYPRFHSRCPTPRPCSAVPWTLHTGNSSTSYHTNSHPSFCLSTHLEIGNFGLTPRARHGYLCNRSNLLDVPCRVQPPHSGWWIKTAVCRQRSLVTQIGSSVPLSFCQAAQAGADGRHSALASKNNIPNSSIWMG